MSTAGTGKRKPYVPQSSLGSVRPDDAESTSAGIRSTHFWLAGDEYVVLSYPKDDLVAPAQRTDPER